MQDLTIGEAVDQLCLIAKEHGAKTPLKAWMLIDIKGQIKSLDILRITKIEVGKKGGKVIACAHVEQDEP
jgi:hypothetical protein